jgi:hypothetical protein
MMIYVVYAWAVILCGGVVFDAHFTAYRSYSTASGSCFMMLRKVISKTTTNAGLGTSSNPQIDDRDTVLTIIFTKGFLSDTIGLGIDGISLHRQLVLTTNPTSGETDGWFRLYRQSGYFVSYDMIRKRLKTLGRSRDEAVVSVYHMNRTYSYNVDFQKGKWLLVSLRDTIRFELLNRQPYFD